MISSVSDNQAVSTSNSDPAVSLAHKICMSVLIENDNKVKTDRDGRVADCTVFQRMPSKDEMSNRNRILLCAFDEMYEHGYQGMRIDTILKTTELGKGALYHHFSSKQALGYAVVDEVLVVAFKRQLIALNTSSDPMALFCELILQHAKACTKSDIIQGCPLNNLAQEMASLDDGFQRRLSLIFDQRHDFLTLALKRGKSLGQVKPDVEEWTVAAFILSSIQGCIGTAKCMQSPQMFCDLIEALCHYIETLRVN